MSARLLLGVVSLGWASLAMAEPSAPSNAEAAPSSSAATPPAAPETPVTSAEAPPADLPPTATLASPVESASACVPDCRSGFECVEGRCVSSCNPPCDPGQLCTPERTCVFLGPPPPGFLLDPRMEAAIVARQKEVARRDALRRRLRPFVGAELSLGVTETDTWQLVDMGPRLFAGARTHVARKIGFEVRAALGLLSTSYALCANWGYNLDTGEIDCADWDTEAETTTTEVMLEAGMIVGPFGPFYLVVPELKLGYWFRDDPDFVKESSYSPEALGKNGVVGGAGFRLGWYLDRDEHFTLYTSFGGTSLPGVEEGHFRWDVLGGHYAF